VEEPLLKVRFTVFDGLPVSIQVNGPNFLIGGTYRGCKVGPSLDAHCLDGGLEVLEGQGENGNGSLKVRKEVKVQREGGSMLVDGKKQEANGAMGLQRVLPSLLCARTWGRGRAKATKGRGVMDGAMEARGFVDAKDGVDQTLDVGVFGHNSSQNGNPSGKEFHHRVQVTTMVTQVELHCGVCQTRMGPNGPRDRGPEGPQGLVRDRGSFGSIEGSRENHHTNELRLDAKGVRRSSNPGNNALRFLKPGSHGPPLRHLANGKVRPKVPQVVDHRDERFEVLPKMGAEALPRGSLGAEGEALAGSNLCPDILQVLVGKVIAGFEDGFELVSNR
jgi:hypothetical protein